MLTRVTSYFELNIQKLSLLKTMVRLIFTWRHHVVTRRSNDVVYLSCLKTSNGSENKC